LPKAEPTPTPQIKRPEQFAWAYPERTPRGEAKPLQTAPAVDADGRVLLHAQGRLVALVEEDGQPKVVWEYLTGVHAPGPVVIAPDGTVRLHCSDGALHCLNSSGRQVFTPVEIGEPLGYAAPACDADGNTYLSHIEGGLVQIDADGRRQQAARYLRTRQKLDAAAVIHEGILYIGSEDGYVFAVELGENKGKNLWDHGAEQGHTGWYIHSAPAMTNDGVLIVAGREEHLYGFAAAGKLLWKTHVPGQMLGSPVLDRQGHIYVGVSQAQRGQEPCGLLACVDGNSHKIRWQYQATGPVESTPVIGDDDVIYFGDNEGVIHAIDLFGKPLWTADVGPPVRSAGTIIAPQRVAFGLDNEMLIVLKCSSQGLAEGGWPKIGGTLAQCGLW